ncbi:hypothetical protein WUBG_00784 [Wuchereria bancrofti]|uniref:Uncharacterized protein n=1 Tax=Wuchereria bancrofti TaxID=6293 RepID=J9BLB9_WUCBA|nr:hypothetical protein WUBG_00784 [Wuchereria bancrofti]
MPRPNPSFPHSSQATKQFTKLFPCFCPPLRFNRIIQRKAKIQKGIDQMIAIMAIDHKNEARLPEILIKSCKNPRQK